jgi:hypothetical protein
MEDLFNFELPKEVNQKDEGFFTDLSNKDYHDFDGLSSTQFSDLALSVAIFKNKEHFKVDSQAFAEGNLNHVALLEPHLLDNFIETNTTTFNTIATDNLKSDYPHKIIVPLGSIEKAKERALKVKLIFGNYLKNAIFESSVIVKNDDIGLHQKARPDIWLQQEGVILDYKTSKESTINGFQKTIEEYNYHLSAAWYMDTINFAIEKLKLNIPKVKTFGWIVSPNNIPHKPFGMVCTQELLEKGRDKYTSYLHKLIEVNQGGQDHLFHPAHSWAYRKENY